MALRSVCISDFNKTNFFNVRLRLTAEAGASQNFSNVTLLSSNSAGLNAPKLNQTIILIFNFFPNKIQFFIAR